MAETKNITPVDRPAFACPRNTPRDIEMTAFDMLGPELRAALNYYPINVTATWGQLRNPEFALLLLSRGKDQLSICSLENMPIAGETELYDEAAQRAWMIERITSLLGDDKNSV